MTGQKSAPWIETTDYRYRNKLMQALKFNASKKFTMCIQWEK